MKKMILVLIVSLSLVLPGQVLARDTMSIEDWKKMLHKCDKEVRKLKEAGKKLDTLILNMEPGRADRGQLLDASDKVNKIKKARKKLTSKIKKYEKCKKKWRLANNVRF